MNRYVPPCPCCADPSDPEMKGNYLPNIFNFLSGQPFCASCLKAFVANEYAGVFHHLSGGEIDMDAIFNGEVGQIYLRGKLLGKPDKEVEDNDVKTRG